MRRPASKLLLLAFTIGVAAALIPRAVVLAQPGCPAPLDHSTLPAAVHESQLVVVGTFDQKRDKPNAYDLGYMDVRPESFLKGATSSGEISFAAGFPFFCQDAALQRGDRILVLAQVTDTDGPVWPSPDRVFRLSDGTAQSLLKDAAASQSEESLIAEIRGLTNQQSVPAANRDEGEGIDWLTTVLPIAGGLAVLFVVGLFLMRIWHRIDPS